jgi:hypothetical protein
MQGKLPLAWEMIRALVRPLAEVMGPFFSFVGVEGGKVRPRAAVVAGLVAALALLTVLRGAPSASALPTFSLAPTLSQSPAGGAAVDPGPGNLITYTLTFTISSTTGNPDTLTAELDVDAQLVVIGLSCSGPGGLDSITPDPPGISPTNPKVGGGTVRCTWEVSSGGVPSGFYAFIVTGYARPGGDNDVDAPTDVEVCDDATTPPDCDDEASEKVVAASLAGSVGVLTINPNIVSPATITAAVGSTVTILWTLQDGYTCESDTDNDSDVECDSGDVSLAPEGAPVSVESVTVVDKDIGDETIVEVKLRGLAAGTVVATVKTFFEGNHAVDSDDINPNQVGVDDVGATVTFAAAPGRLMGDVDCDNNVTVADALKILRFLAGLPVVQNEPCPDIGTPQ